jgi:hypothetical protein
MTEKTKRATEILNVELAGIDSALTVLKSLLNVSADSPAGKVIEGALGRCEAARETLIDIRFHAGQI